ncbi:DNA-binding pseudobarrel domain superfamily [Arabidopsis suecica]|uniref:DNA-binding pseudobarrel domain superfamily n=1 Tax=Arabidopsis suecica TaxID=45249 RepID=A0A8T2AGJ4_ARASU|nr:DNA-binding pseudobarrel domain superfamily [Arabidopsis suecica]
MFEVKMVSKMCMNASCGTTSTVEWKKGWPLRSGLLADLCYRCGSAYESSLFCEQFHKDQSGWRECYLCNKRLHCGCIASKVTIELMDYGGVGCSTCTCCHQLNLGTRGENPGVFSRLPMKPLADRQHVNGESGMNIDGGRNEAGLFSQPLVMGGDKREEFMPHRGFGQLMNSENTTTGYRLDAAGEIHESSPSQPSLNMGLAVNPFSPSFATEGVEGKKHISASQSNMVHCSASNILQKPSKPAISTPPVASKSAQARIGRPPVEGRGKGHLLPRYWPKYTDKEVQQISGNLNLNIVPLFEKTLSASDAGRIGRLVLPKACAEAYFPPISQSEGIPLKIQDVRGKEWTFQFRYWPNNNSRMYVLEGVTPCIQSMMLQAGDTVTFSRVDPGGKLIMGSRKAANAGDMQGCGLTNGTSTEDTSSSGVTENPPSINGSSCPSLIPQELNGMPENLSAQKSETNGGRIGDDPTRVKEKKRTRTIGAKNKRLLLHSEESVELRLTWEEAQDLLRPSPSAKPTIVVIEEKEIEEYDEPPVFGKRTIVTTRPSGEQERWATCDDCSKWRRLPVDALLPFKWTCIDNVWDVSRCSCSAPEESLKELENVLKVGREYKKRRTGESQAAKSQQEPCGLDALASAAVLGDTIGEPEVATTTRHPRHRAGCSCIVCIQPPSGKGRHKPTCGCTVCSTVKRRFKTLMMRRKKKQLERDVTAAEDKKKKDMELAESDKSKEEKEVNTARIDLNSDPYNKEDAEAVAVEKEESRKRAIGQCSGVVTQGAGDVLGVTELEGEAKKVGEEPRVSS